MGEHNAYGSDACLGGLAEGIMEEIAAATYVLRNRLFIGVNRLFEGIMEKIAAATYASINQKEVFERVHSVYQ